MSHRVAGKPSIVITGADCVLASSEVIQDAAPRLFATPGDADRAEFIADRAIAAAWAMAAPEYDPTRIASTITSSKLGIAPLLAALDRGHVTAEAWRRFIAPPLGPAFARGATVTTIAACATGLAAIARGVMLLENDEADVVLAGAIEGSIHPLLAAGFRRMGVLSATRPRPFDRRRDGFVMAEGGAVLVLEREEDARARGARAIGRVRGFALAAETAHAIIGGENGERIAALVNAALADAAIVPSEIAYVHLHGTGTRRNDAAEIDALRRFFGARGLLPFASSTKGRTGHCLGAAGAVEACLTLEALRSGILPASDGLEEIDEACRWEGLLTAPRQTAGRIGLVLSYGFGGHLAALVIEGIP